MDISNKKVALVHDYLLRIGGAERVLKVLHEMFPDAPIYTVLYDKKFANEFLNGAKIRASFLQKLPGFLRRRYKYFSFFIPSAVESLDLSEFDIIISSSSAFSKGVITRPDAIHICYCHTPTRFLWDWTHAYSKYLGESVYGLPTRILFHFLRIWDRHAASRVDYFVANSKHVAARIRKYYGRDAKVIYPPVESGGRGIDFLTHPRPPSGGLPACACTHADRRGSGHFAPSVAPSEARDTHFSNSSVKPRWEKWHMPKRPSNPSESNTPHPYYLIVSQLRPYKQIDIAVEAFKKLGFPLVIIGEGDDEKRLKNLGRGYDNIKFLGGQKDDVVSEYYKNCRAFVFSGEEDFGITMVEAMSYGKPVLALREGGAKEIVLENITGEFFDEAHPLILADGLRRLNENYNMYSPIVIKKRAEKFSRVQFERELYDFIEKCFKL